MRTYVLAIALGISICMIGSTPSMAQSIEDNDARALYELGERAFEQGRFQAALDYFQQSYDLSGRPQLLFNIGQAADRVRQDQRALSAFEAYIAALPEVSNRRVVEARIEILRRTIAQAAEAPSVNAAASDVASPPSEGAPEAPNEATADEADMAEGVTEPTRHGRAGAFLLAGAGAGALLAGTAVLALGVHDYRSVTGAAQDSAWADVADAHDRASTRITVGLVLMGVGAAAGTVGLALSLRSHDDEDATTGALELRVLPSGFIVRRTF